MKTKTDVGIFGEKYAIELLKSKGYEVIDRNFRSRFGEIDIIALDAKTLVFVEVKARRSTKFGRAIEAVGSKKLTRITRTADYYVLKNGLTKLKQRIEVCAIDIQNGKLKSANLVPVY